MSKSSSDYFRAGGAMPWWITGTSAWIAGFTAWTFVGAAAKVYETGTLVLVVYYSSVLAYFVVYYYSCIRFRRMRTVTWMEAVRARFGAGTEQFYTWVKVPLSLLFAGVSLNSIGVFMSAVFDVPIDRTMIVLGIIITIVAVAGGAWAVLASDFVQMFLVMTITLVTAYLALAQPKVGGLSGLLQHVPSAHFHWSELARPEIIVMWIVVQLWFKFSDNTSIEASTMYLMAKSDRDARRMVLIPLIGSLLGPVIWFIPSMAATITHPNLAADFPLMKQPHEAAFIATALDVMPQGLMALLICAMLGATLTSMDAGLNKNVGVFVRSFYRPIFGRHSSERKLLLVGKLTTVLFGIAIVLIGRKFNDLRTIGLFDLSNLLAGALLMPMAVPLVWGIFYKRTPGWSAWSSALVGFAISMTAESFLRPEHVQHLLGWTRPLSLDREWPDARLAFTTLSAVLAGSLWFFGTTFFYPKGARATQDTRRIEEFFLAVRTPVHADSEVQVNYDGLLYRMMGLLFLVFGSFVTLLVLIPNTLQGRACFLFCGGTILAAGGCLYALSRRDLTLGETATLRPSAIDAEGGLNPAALAAVTDGPPPEDELPL
ncbi:MAG: sodium:solute symporter family transporter [Tepidisphaeraceae bacterium]